MPAANLSAMRGFISKSSLASILLVVSLFVSSCVSSDSPALSEVQVSLAEELLLAEQRGSPGVDSEVYWDAARCYWRGVAATLSDEAIESSDVLDMNSSLDLGDYVNIEVLFSFYSLGIVDYEGVGSAFKRCIASDDDVLADLEDIPLFGPLAACVLLVIGSFSDDRAGYMLAGNEMNSREIEMIDLCL